MRTAASSPDLPPRLHSQRQRRCLQGVNPRLRVGGCNAALAEKPDDFLPEAACAVMFLLPLNPDYFATASAFAAVKVPEPSMKENLPSVIFVPSSLSLPCQVMGTTLIIL